MVAGSTLTACFRSEETWRFQGFMGKKRSTYLKKKKRTILHHWCSFWAPEARPDPPPSCFYSPRVSLKDHKPQIPCQLCLVCWLQGQEDPRLLPIMQAPYISNSGSLPGSPGCAGGRTAQAWGQLTSYGFHHNYSCFKTRAGSQACRYTAMWPSFK